MQLLRKLNNEGGCMSKSKRSNSIEFEAKVLDINLEEIQQSLERLNATMKGDYTFRRYVFDTMPSVPSKWIRLRTNGAETTIAVKEIADDSIEGTEEWEVGVTDFDTMLTILRKSGLSPKGYQENR